VSEGGGREALAGKNARTQSRAPPPAPPRCTTSARLRSPAVHDCLLRPHTRACPFSGRLVYGLFERDCRRYEEALPIAGSAICWNYGKRYILLAVATN
jgi:hypothetical protein